VIAVRELPAAGLERLGELDRSEHVTGLYAHRDGALERVEIDDRVPAWSQSQVDDLLKAWRPIVDAGGTLLGAFDADTFAGLAIYRPRLAPDLGNLALLHVSRGYRGRGIGARLVREVARLARQDGATRLYVSATPTVRTVEFYRSLGFAPTDAPHPELFALEPEDIHMVLTL